MIVSNPISVDLDDDFVEIILPPVYNMPDRTSTSVLDVTNHTSVLEGSVLDSSLPPGTSTTWRPLLLIIPLRLGLHEFNMRYASTFQVSFFLSIRGLPTP